MRELKFRAWLKNYKCYADVLGFEQGRLFVQFQSGERSQHRLYVPIEDCILEQYTGLKDKNGKEIYEWDIVRYGRHLSGIIPPESLTAVVKWWSGEEEYYPCCTSSGFSLPFSEDGYEVIGNVHENPELLEAKDVN